MQGSVFGDMNRWFQIAFRISKMAESKAESDLQRIDSLLHEISINTISELMFETKLFLAINHSKIVFLPMERPARDC